MRPEIDAGPIIAQGVEDVRHTQDPAMLQRRGKNIGRAVLAARAAGVQAGDRVHVHENGTIIHA